MYPITRNAFPGQIIDFLWGCVRGSQERRTMCYSQPQTNYLVSLGSQIILRNSSHPLKLASLGRCNRPVFISAWMLKSRPFFNMESWIRKKCVRKYSQASCILIFEIRFSKRWMPVVDNNRDRIPVYESSLQLIDT